MKTDVIYEDSGNYFKTRLGSAMNVKFSILFIRIEKFFSGKEGLDWKAIVLKFKLKRLEKSIRIADNKKIELDKLLSEFHYRHSVELGDLLLEILKVRTLLFPLGDSGYEDAKKEEERFREQLLADRAQQKHQITKDEKVELKKKFRKATVLCHPDKVDEKYSVEAKEIFISLKSAYDSNDLKKVSSILFNLEKGNYFKPKSQTVSEKEKLISEIAKLRIRIKSTEKDIELIKKSFEYKMIIAIANWDEYFRNMKTKLETELAEMKAQLVFEKR